MLTVRISPHFQPEKTYALRVLLDEILRLPHQVEVSDEARDYAITLPNGKQITIADQFFRHLPPDAPYALRENLPRRVTHAPDPCLPGDTLTGLYGEARFTPFPEGLHCALDVVASAFLMLSRWEEVALPDRDKHGRFPAEASLAFRHNFLNRPVVHEWARLLRNLMARLDFFTPYPAQPASTLLTCDVDHPRLWWTPADQLRTLGGSLWKRLQPREALYWLGWKKKRKDPFDTFDTLMDLARHTGQAAHFHFLGKRPTTSDCYYPLHHPDVQQIMRRIQRRGHVIGFHPSYEAHGDAARFQEELESLRQVTDQPVLTGRHHYLRFSAPATWRMWEQAGMTWDSTVGYPEHPGFRCGMASTFPVFDLEQRTPLRLREKPLHVMDVTLLHYRDWSHPQAIRMVRELRQQVDRHGGEFVLLWHNSSLYGWSWEFWGAQEVLESALT